MSRQSDFVSETRQDVRDLWNALNRLVAKQREWTALDYLNTLTDFTGSNEGLTAAEVGACVFDTPNAIVTDVLNAGHSTNLAKLL